MASENIMSEVGGQLADKFFSSMVWFFLGLVIFAAVGFTMWFFLVYKKKFDIKVKIISERAGNNNVEIFDKGAILTDRGAGTPYLRVWGLKRDFPVPKYNVMRKIFSGNSEIDYIEIYRKGENEFYFLLPPKINNAKVIKSDGKLHSIANQEQLMVDPEMAFWAVKRKTLNKKMLNTESLVMKLLPYMGVMMGGVIMIFILYILLDHLPGILSELRSLVSEMRQYYRAEVITGSIPLLIRYKKNAR